MSSSVVVTGDPVVVDPATVERFAAAVRAPAGEIPPTFAAALTAPVQHALFADPRLGLDLSRTLHTQQQLDVRRPLRLGETVVATAEVTRDRVARGARALTVTTTLRDAGGEVVQVAETALLSGGAGGEAA